MTRRRSGVRVQGNGWESEEQASMKRHTNTSLPTVVRWVARVTGGALCLLVAAIAVGHWPLPNPFRQPPAVAFQFAFMAAMTVGLIIAWRWELTGALASLIGFLGFNLVEVSVNGRIAGGLFPLFAVPTALYLLDVELRRLTQESP